MCALLSGGNIDPTLLISVMRHGLTLAGRYLVVRTRIPDSPGALVELLELVAAERGNVVSVEHHREGMAVHVGETEVELTVVTRNEDHCSELCAALERRGYRLERLRLAAAAAERDDVVGEVLRCRRRRPARTSNPSRCSSDAAIVARAPLSQIVTTGRSRSSAPQPSLRIRRYGMLREPGR